MDTAKSFIDDYLDMATYELPDGRIAMKVGGRGEFVVKMKEFMEKEGIERSKDETITDLGGSDRLRLIFDTQTRMAHDYGNYRQGLDAEMYFEFPAWRFIRAHGVKDPRSDHDEHENEVRLKSDVAYWTARNDPDFGGFGVPWGPWGFNSGMDVYDVSRDEAIAEGVLAEGEFPLPPKVLQWGRALVSAEAEPTSDAIGAKECFNGAALW